MASLEELFAVVLGDHDHNVARVTVRSPDGDFSLEFATGMADGPSWNIASDPPRDPPDSYGVIDEGRAFAHVKSDAETPEQAVEELRELIDHIGGEHTRIQGTKTFETLTGDPEPMKALREYLADRVPGVGA